MKKKVKTISLVTAAVLILGAAAYGIAYHTGAEAKIENGVISTYDKVQNGVVSTYQNVQDFFTGDSGSSGN